MWQLVSMDLFDREAAPRVEATSSSLEAALTGLWLAVLRQGVQDDGTPTFTAFELHSSEGRRVSIPRDPLKNPALAQLRARLEEPELVTNLARMHAERLEAPWAFAPFLSVPVSLPPRVTEVVRALAHALGTSAAVTATTPGWRCGERIEISSSGLLRGHSFESAQMRWVVKAEGLVVTLTDVAEAGWYREVSSDGGPNASVLRDVLASEGLC